MESEPQLTRPSLRELLSALSDAATGGTAGASEDAWREALDPHRDTPSGEAHPAWFVRVLVGFGAWVSALLFALAAGASGIAKTPESLGVLGLLAFAGGVVLRRAARGEFPVQLALAASIGGRMMVYGSVFNHGEGPAAWCVALVLEAVGLAAYPDVVGRFVATLGLCVAAFGLGDALHLPVLSRQVLILSLAASATWIWLREPTLLAARAAPFQRPVGFGLVVALMGALLVDLWKRPDGQQWHFSLIAAGLTALLLVVEREVLRETLAHHRRVLGYRIAAPRNKGPTAPAPPETRALVYAGTLALGALGQLAPGLMGALLVMALGAHRRNRLLFGMAALFLAFFGSHFYYSLGLTLLAKSGVLFASGLVCLALRLPLARAAEESSS
jgi:hypothetical protein